MHAVRRRGSLPPLPRLLFSLFWSPFHNIPLIIQLALLAVCCHFCEATSSVYGWWPTDSQFLIPISRLPVICTGSAHLSPDVPVWQVVSTLHIALCVSYTHEIHKVRWVDGWM